MNRSEGGAGAVLTEDQICVIEPGDHLPGGHLIANIDEPLDDLAVPAFAGISETASA